MTYIITRLCRDCLDTGCVAVCPVDCIYKYEGDDKDKFPDQLYIHPDECIDCGACEPECPWQAIFEEVAVPDVFEEDTPLNYAMLEDGETVDGFVVAPHEKPDDNPSAEDIQANKEKWGWDG
jgi:ferredoxin